MRMLMRMTMALLLATTLAACGGDDAPDEPADPGEGIAISMVDLDFVPGRIDVPAGETVTVTLTNDGAAEHDFVMEDGTDSGLVQPGASATVDIGPFEESTVAWCNVPGHREAGMEVEIAVG